MKGTPIRRGTTQLLFPCLLGLGSLWPALVLAQTPQAAPAAPPRQAAPGPPRLLPASIQEYLAGTEYGGRYALSDLVTSSIHGGRIGVTVHLPNALERQLERNANGSSGTRPIRISIDGSDLTWSIKTYGDPGPERTVALACYDSESLGAFQCVALHVKPGLVKIYGQSFDKPGIQAMLDLSQTADGLTFAWRIPGEAEQTGRVESLAELRRRFPQFTQTVLAPVTRRLGLRGLVRHHPAAEVYLAFPSIRPDDEVARRVRDLLPRLGAPRPSVREKASAELYRMGRPAVLAVLRLDRTALSPEQNARLEIFLRSAGSAGFPAGAGGVPARPVSAPVVDVDFLIDCLDDEDPQVRDAAKRQLEVALGRPIAFNPALMGEARSAAVDRLFEQIDRPVQGAAGSVNRTERIGQTVR